jgi:hypothetical protein
MRRVVVVEEDKTPSLLREEGLDPVGCDPEGVPESRKASPDQRGLEGERQGCPLIIVGIDIAVPADKGTVFVIELRKRSSSAVFAGIRDCFTDIGFQVFPDAVVSPHPDEGILFIPSVNAGPDDPVPVHHHDIAEFRFNPVVVPKIRIEIPDETPAGLRSADQCPDKCRALRVSGIQPVLSDKVRLERVGKGSAREIVREHVEFPVDKLAPRVIKSGKGCVLSLFACILIGLLDKCGQLFDRMGNHTKRSDSDLINQQDKSTFCPKETCMDPEFSFGP